MHSSNLSHQYNFNSSHVHFIHYSYSHSVMGNMSKLGSSMSTMMGMNDYGFLYTTGSVRFMSTMRVKSRQSGIGDGDEDVKRPSIDD